MSKIYVCQVCGYNYDEKAGDSASDIAPNTAFSSLSDDYVCPICGVDKSNFEQA